MEVLENAAAARTPLLRVEAGPGESLLLTFEAGPVLVRAEPRVGVLRAELIEPGNTALRGTAILNEEEPWWRLIGSPLFCATAIEEGGGVALQFRADTDNPRVVEIVSKGAILHVCLRALEIDGPSRH